MLVINTNKGLEIAVHVPLLYCHYMLTDDNTLPLLLSSPAHNAALCTVLRAPSFTSKAESLPTVLCITWRFQREPVSLRYVFGKKLKWCVAYLSRMNINENVKFYRYV